MGTVRRLVTENVIASWLDHKPVIDQLDREILYKTLRNRAGRILFQVDPERIPRRVAPLFWSVF